MHIWVIYMSNFLEFLINKTNKYIQKRQYTHSVLHNLLNFG